MKTNLLFDFKVDEENNTIEIKREFDTDLPLVWKAWTTSELLDQWWAPKPYHVETKSLELIEGGTWLYAMVSPEGEKTWCKADYKKIEMNEELSWLDAFCDQNGNSNTTKPRSLWNNKFSAKDGRTLVNMTLHHDKLEDIQTMIEMGFKEGFTMALENLDQLLER
ncbi:SRPBCC domain-containing protein [Euzebyella marina]|uniref:SRPBCC domain-containing protein n=1 Tax=Euzebyella marina TaxID=1761453 RepID=A0A3G2L7J6_9FLAO|nr:SRPBCC domain-containing protein [Euzebyella marina]AYN68230.1 SRPBCC domain-containing protein [Euzebyella marina]